MTKKLANPSAPWARAKEGRTVLTRVTGWASAICDRLVADCHPKQRDAVLDPSDRVTVLCGGRAGKTTSAEVRLLLALLTRPEAQCAFIATTKEHAANISWRKFTKILRRLGVDFHESLTRRAITIVKNGSLLLLAGADDKPAIEKLRGIPWDGVVIDEAASHPAKLLEWLIERALDARTAERGGWIMMIGTPGHILAGPFYEATRPGGSLHRPYAERETWAEEERVWSSHNWSLKDAADAGVEPARLSWEAAIRRKRLMGWSDDNPVWLREYEGKWAADETDMVFRYRAHDAAGEAWNQWAPEYRGGPMRVAVLPAELAEADDVTIVVTFDKGFKDDFATNAWAFSPSDPRRRVWHVFAHEVPRMSVRRFACLLLGEREREDEAGPPEPNEVDVAIDGGHGLFGVLGYPAAMAGDVDGAFLLDLGYYGIRAAKVDKKLDAKVTTIEEINGDLAEGRWFVIAGSPLEQQLRTLQWVPADEVGGVIKENKAQKNHSTDTMIYAKRLISPMQGVHAPPPAEDDEEAGGRAKAPARPKPPARPRAARPVVPADEGEREVWKSALASATYGGPEW